MFTDKELLTTGRTPLLFPGASVESIVSVLGDHDGEFDYEEGSYLQYGRLQLRIEAAKLISFIVGFEEKKDQIDLPGVLALPWLASLDASTNIESLVTDLDEVVHAYDWRVYEKYTFDRQVCIKTEGDVGFFFSLDRPALQKLVCPIG